MRKIIILAMLIFTVTMLAACEEEIKETKELIFIKKGEETKTHKSLLTTEERTSYYMHFESKEDKAYYAIKITGWEYDNIDYEPGEVIEFTYEVSSTKYPRITNEDFKDYRILNEANITRDKE